MTIGDVSRATRLSAEALRFHHQAAVLEPASIGAFNGYRLYDPGRITDAQVVGGDEGMTLLVDSVGGIADGRFAPPDEPPT